MLQSKTRQKEEIQPSFAASFFHGPDLHQLVLVIDVLRKTSL